MGIFPENGGSVALRPKVESSVPASEPVVEFARKRSLHSEGLDVKQVQRGGAEQELAEPLIKNQAKVILPRDSSAPLISSNNSYAGPALDAYQILRTRLLKAHAAQGFRCIAITSAARAEGKTLTAFNLACCCAHVSSLSVLLIDGDLRTRSLTKLIGGLPRVGLADVMSDKASCEEAIAMTNLPNLYVMGAGTSNVAPTELFSTEKWGEVMRWSRRHFKIVLIDTLSLSGSADFELIAPECDGILLVVRARSTNRDALKLAMEQLDASKLVGVVWNGAQSL